MPQETEAPEAPRAPCDEARRYANALEIDFTLAEFTLDFVQSFGPDAPAPRQCRLVTSPLNMSRFRDAFAEAIADYEGRYGALPRPLAGRG